MVSRSAPLAPASSLIFDSPALLDFWATDLLFKLFPSSTPRHLTFLRAVLVSNPTLAFLAARLQVHRTILHSSPLLELAMLETVQQTSKYTWSDVVSGDLTWLWDPPKVMGDCFEAVLGAIFVDAGCALPPVFDVLDLVFAGVKELLPAVESRVGSASVSQLDLAKCLTLRTLTLAS